jgi:hypothetical protein
MSDQIEQQTLQQLYGEYKLGAEMQALVTRTHSTILGRVQTELDGLRLRLVDLDDVSTDEYRKTHARARMLSELFGQIHDVIKIGEQAARVIEQIENESGVTKNG